MNNFYTMNIEMYKYEHQDYESSDHYAEHLLQRAKQYKGNIQMDKDDFLLVTTLLWEPHLLDNFSIYKNLFDSFKRKRINTILILDSYYKGKDVTELATKIYYVNYFLWRTYDKVVRQKKSKVNASWNSTSNKFLILNGKPGRVNRVRLLWKLKHLLDNAIWSLHVHSGTWQESREHVHEISDEEFADFVKTYNNNPDDANIVFQDNSLHYGGIPYDVSLFDSTLFRIVTETNFNTKGDVIPWLTEKTFITILNRQPFIIAGDKGSLGKLKTMGFRTFENYLPVQDYDQIEDPELKLDAIVTNTKFWINHMDQKEMIKEDVEHNYAVLEKLAMQNKSTLEGVCIQYGINPNSVEQICTTFDILGNE
tara:strand:+ start:700 stop:1797 length:1098 start_codon:yes stop_codon:yes gene_type:complete